MHASASAKSVQLARMFAAQSKPRKTAQKQVDIIDPFIDVKPRHPNPVEKGAADAENTGRPKSSRQHQKKKMDKETADALTSDLDELVRHIRRRFATDD